MPIGFITYPPSRRFVVSLGLLNLLVFVLCMPIYLSILATHMSDDSSLVAAKTFVDRAGTQNVPVAGDMLDRLSNVLSMNSEFFLMSLVSNLLLAVLLAVSGYLMIHVKDTGRLVVRRGSPGRAVQDRRAK